MSSGGFNIIIFMAASHAAIVSLSTANHMPTGNDPNSNNADHLTRAS